MRAALACLLALGLVSAPRAAATYGEGGFGAAAPAAVVPVLLVPGWFDSDRDLAALRIWLIGAGWGTEEVATVSFADPTGGNRVHAAEIDSAAQALLRTTGAARVDVVAHSMGGLATRWYLMHGGDRHVRRAVFIASPHAGTYTAYLAWGDGSAEMKPGSAFLDSLNAAPPVPEHVEALTIRTPLDTHVVPTESATLPGVPDRSVCCPTHAGLLRDLEVFQIVRDFLEDGADRAAGGGAAR